MNCTTCEDRPRSKNDSYCKQCRAVYQAAYAKRTNYKDSKQRIQSLRQFLIEAKKGPCKDCGLRYPWYVMDFDHILGKKEFNLSVAAAKRIGVARIKREIAKCDLVCANCHRERTFNRSHVA